MRSGIWILTIMLLVVAAFGASMAVAQKASTNHTKHHAVAYYACPKCEVAMTHAGKCPSCRTALVSAKGKVVYACASCKTESAKPGKCPKCGAAMQKSLATYACDKCEVTSAKPGKCPKCGDKLARHVLPIHG